MGIFDGIEEAKETGGTGNYIGPGTHIVRVDRCVQGKNMSGQPYCLAEVTILSSTDENVRRGTPSTWYQGFKYRDSALPNIKSFIFACCAALGAPMKESEFNVGVANEAFGEEQLLKGAIIVVHCYKQETKTTRLIKSLPDSERKYYSKYSFRAPTEDEVAALVA